MLEMRNVVKTFNKGTVDEKVALAGLSLTVKEGEFVTVIGGNGAGKSTMQNAICGTWRPDSGSILLDGIDVTRLPEHKRAKYLGRVYQDPMLGTAAAMQIEENLALAFRRGRHRTLMRGVPPQADRVGVGAGESSDRQSRNAVGRSASSPDVADGYASKAAPVAVG